MFLKSPAKKEKLSQLTTKLAKLFYKLLAMKNYQFKKYQNNYFYNYQLCTQ